MTYEGFTPHRHQKQILDGILSSTAKHHICSVGRQYGKSMMGMNLALYWMINDGPCSILWVSPVYSQANKVMKEMVNAIQTSGLVKTANLSANEIVLKNGSNIIFRSAERYDNIRGGTYDYSIIDEAAFMRDEAWNEAIRPTLLVRGKKVLFISTPKGKNYFYELFQLGQSDDHPNYKSYRGSSYDTPYINPEEIEEAKKIVPDPIFRQEYMAEFLDGGGEVFTNLDNHTFVVWPKPEGKIFCGIDLGKQEDWTVATFMDTKGRVVDIYRDNKQDWTTMVREILQRIRKWNATTMIEVNSIGDVIYEMIKKEWQDTHAFVTSHKSKTEIIEGLIVDFNNSEIQIPSKGLFGPLYDELGYFTYEYNPKTRNVRYGHPNGLHDDTVMSLAICNYNRKTNKSLGSYAYKSRR